MKIMFVIEDDRLRIEAELGEAADADAFARAYNEARDRLWPAEPEKPAPPRGILTIRPGSRAEQVLALLREGVTDVTAIADRLDLTNGIAGTLKAGLIRGGHWKSGGKA